MPLRAYAMDWGRNRTLMVGKNSGPILSRLWTKVHDIWGKRRGHLVPEIRHCLEVVDKLNKCKTVLAPNFWAG